MENNKQQDIDFYDCDGCIHYSSCDWPEHWVDEGCDLKEVSKEN